MKLSIIIPAYNEIETIERVLAKVQGVLSSVEKEIIVVDDGSKDGTWQWLRDNRFPNVVTIFHKVNRGKGAAVRTGLDRAKGDVVVIQDADLEYDPDDWERMLPLITEMKVADVVFGSRFYGEPHRSLYFHHYMGNRLISFLFNVLYNQMLSDVEVCYKMFTREVLESLHLTSNGFGFEIELSAQIARPKKWRIYEVGIRYYGRTYAEGKKINWKDGLKALAYLIKYRL